MTFTVAPLQASHRLEVDELLRATGAFRPDEVQVALSLFDESFTAAPADGGQPDYEFVAAIGASQALAGYACFGATPGTHGTYDLYWLVVHPEYQGAGVGSALVGEVARQLAARGARLLVAETSGQAGYQAARRFYDARGFTAVARIRDFYAPADDRVVFTRHLGRSPSPAPLGAPSP